MASAYGSDLSWRRRMTALGLTHSVAVWARTSVCKITEGEKEPTKFWLSTLAKEIDFTGLVDSTMMRWRIERDYPELRQEVGLGHFEGRGWRGLHHHATMCIAACGFLISERGAFPPRTLVPELSARNLPFPRVIDPEAPPLRPERHVLNSIASLRVRLNAGLVASCRATPAVRDRWTPTPDVATCDAVRLTRPAGPDLPDEAASHGRNPPATQAACNP